MHGFPRFNCVCTISQNSLIDGFEFLFLEASVWNQVSVFARKLWSFYLGSEIREIRVVRLIKPLHSNISMHILHTVLYNLSRYLQGELV